MRHALADRERRVEQAVQHRPDGARRVGDRVRVLHLPENLRLAHHQRVEAGGDAEQVPRDVQVDDARRCAARLARRLTPLNSLTKRTRSWRVVAAASSQAT